MSEREDYITALVEVRAQRDRLQRQNDVQAGRVAEYHDKALVASTELRRERASREWWQAEAERLHAVLVEIHNAEMMDFLPIPVPEEQAP